MTSSDLEFFRRRRQDFPSLARMHNGRPLVYFDGPAGTQIPGSVIDAISAYYRTCNANTHGQFITTRESDEVLLEARRATAEFLGAPSWSCISFGANMTTLAFSLSKAIARTLRPGDEVLITQLDHEANRGPWLSLQERGAVIREVALKPDGTLDENDLRRKISSRPKLLAMGMASNALGTVNDFRLARELTRATGTLLLLDAVHFAPHFPIDVGETDPDFLLCSAYKFYGPHVGILYTRPRLLDQLQTDCLRTQDQSSPYRIETGTLNHAAIAGVQAAIDYIATCGTGNDRRARIVSGMERIARHEHILASRLFEGLSGIRTVKVVGQPISSHRRAPTVSFTVEGMKPEEVCARLGEEGICAWDGHFYALRAIEVLGLLERGGVTRVGMSLYNMPEEVDRFLEEVKNIVP